MFSIEQSTDTTISSGVHAAILVFSTVDRESFKDIRKWKNVLMAECRDAFIVLVQNKIDLIDQVHFVQCSRQCDSFPQERCGARGG